MAEPLLDVRDLRVSFRTEDGLVRAVDGVSFSVAAGEVLGIVGESGSGKSVTAMSLMRLIRDPNAITEGEVIYKGRDLLKLEPGQMRDVRGSEIAMIFQDPMTSLNPVYRVGWQIAEQIQAHEKVSNRGAHKRAVELLKAVGIPQPDRRADDYPHQFSGGMRQRAMIAMALACNPDLLIADEPTTALDVTIQAQILALLRTLQRDFGSAIVVITHDMGVVADLADRVCVMYAGRVVEDGPKRELFANAQHPYTWGLLGSIPRIDRPKPRRLTAIPGLPPSLLALPSGCSFAPRCPHVFPACAERPALEERAAPGHLDRCFLPVPRSAPAATRRSTRSSRREPGAAARGARGHQTLPGQGRRRDPPRGGPGAGGRRRLLRGAAGRDARARGGVGLWQVDARPLHHSAARTDRRPDHLRWARHLDAQPPGAATAAAADANGLPGSLRLAQPDASAWAS